MMRSLYSGISGLRNHQTRMDVIGNNIANVNTTGYKTSRVIFQDIFSQTAAGGTAGTPDLGVGGTNPMQIGLGIKLSSVDILHTPAPFQRTDNPLDMMIGGEGFFIVQGPEGPFYTRAGNFKIDDQGYLVTTDGFYVMGTAYELYYDPGQAAVGTDPTDADYVPAVPAGIFVDKDVQINDEPPLGLSRICVRVENLDYDGVDDPDDADYMGPEFFELVGFSVGKDGSVEVIIDNRKATIAQLAVAMFSNPGGLEKAGNSLYRETSSSGGVQVGIAYQNGAGTVEAGGLEMSNVDLATEFTDMIVTQRGFQANSRIITVSDTMLEELVNLKR